MSYENDHIKNELEGLDTRGMFKQNLSPEVIFFIQLQRCLKLQAINDNGPEFASAVNGLLSVSPVIVRDAVNERSGEYKYSQYDFQYTYFCGLAGGTPDNPITAEDVYKKQIPVKHIFEEIKNEETGETKLIDKGIDWNDPNIISPKRVFTSGVDWSVLLMIICEEAEYAKISWKTKGKAKITSIEVSKAAKNPAFRKVDKKDDEDREIS